MRVSAIPTSIAPLSPRERCRARTLPCESAAKKPIDANASENSGANRDHVHVGDLTPGIERCEKKKASEPAGDSGGDDFCDDEAPAPGASMVVGEVPLAAGTSRHGSDQSICPTASR